MRISSRRRVPAELQLMASVAARLPAWARQMAAGIWCDSKAGAFYVIEVRPEFDRLELTEHLAAVLRLLLLELGGGYNGVTIGETSWLDPDWGEDAWEPIEPEPLPASDDNEDWARWIQGRPIAYRGDRKAWNGAACGLDRPPDQQGRCPSAGQIEERKDNDSRQPRGPDQGLAADRSAGRWLQRRDTMGRGGRGVRGWIDQRQDRQPSGRWRAPRLRRPSGRAVCAIARHAALPLRWSRRRPQSRGPAMQADKEHERGMQAIHDAGDRFGVVDHYRGRLSDGAMLVIWSCRLERAGHVVTIGTCRPDMAGTNWDHPPISVRASELPALVALVAGAMAKLGEEREVADLGADGDPGAGAIRDRDGRHWLALVRHDGEGGEDAVAVLAADAPTLHRAFVAAADAVAGATAMGQARGQLAN